jgi:amidohydrolase
MDLINQIKKLSKELAPEITQIRRHLHMHPELSYLEKETSEYISQILDKAGIVYRKGIVKTGILAKISGQLEGKKVVALRAELDALPIEEMNDIAYKSVNQGIMHACGHDAHSASLIGTAMILDKLKHRFGGTIILVFQPGEEKAPGGAKLMLDQGIFNDVKPDLILAQHAMPSMASGTAGFCQGTYMASSDELYITIKGRGGHAAMPHQITDTVLAASQIIVALQQIVSRNADPFSPTVLSFGKIRADGAVNVIPSEVFLEGTFRTMNDRWKKEAHRQMKKIAQSIATGMGATCEFNIVEGYPVLYNDPGITALSKEHACKFLGDKKVLNLEPRMTAEDFAFFAQQIPATFYRLGVSNAKKGISADLHSPFFDIDEEALETGMGLMAYLAVRHLAGKD